MSLQNKEMLSQIHSKWTLVTWVQKDRFSPLFVKCLIHFKIIWKSRQKIPFMTWVLVCASDWNKHSVMAQLKPQFLCSGQN